VDCKGKQVLLTGATGGIGQAIAAELDRAGARLTLVGRNSARLAELQHRLSDRHRVIAVDINDAGQRDTLVRQCDRDGQEPEAIETMVLTNLLAPMLLCRALLPALQRGGETAIVNIGSIFGSIGHPGFTAYCATKFGLRGFTEALQRELHDSNVRVSYLAPRATRTDLNSAAVTALNEALGNATDEPERVAEELMKVLGARRHQHYMGWPENLFVRLNGLFPGVVHSALARKLHIIRRHAEP
jgi:short-subunit dehydrogenase